LIVGFFSLVSRVILPEVFLWRLLIFSGFLGLGFVTLTGLGFSTGLGFVAVGLSEIAGFVSFGGNLTVEVSLSLIESRRQASSNPITFPNFDPRLLTTDSAWWTVSSISSNSSGTLILEEDGLSAILVLRLCLIIFALTYSFTYF
jgi:hypothetical protein